MVQKRVVNLPYISTDEKIVAMLIWLGHVDFTKGEWPRETSGLGISSLENP